MITNFQISKVDCRARHDVPISNVSINHELLLKNTQVISQKTPFGNTNILRVNYQFNIKYASPDMGNLFFDGIIDYYAPSDIITIIHENWETRNVDAVNAKNIVANAIISNIIPFAMLISSRLNLPSVIQIPQINFNKPKEEPPNYIG